MHADARPRRASTVAVLACLLATVVLATSGPLGVTAREPMLRPENLVVQPFTRGRGELAGVLLAERMGHGGDLVGRPRTRRRPGDLASRSTGTPPATASSCRPRRPSARRHVAGRGARTPSASGTPPTAAVQLTIVPPRAAGMELLGRPRRVRRDGRMDTRPTVDDTSDARGHGRLVFGLSLAADGTLTTDDYSLVNAGAPLEPRPRNRPHPHPQPRPSPPNHAHRHRPSQPHGPPANLVANPALADGEGMPDVLHRAGWGENTPRQRHRRRRADRIRPPGTRDRSRSTCPTDVSGDVKLLQSDDAGCAPDVAEGGEYDVSIDYRSTSLANSLTVFQHTTEGWSYWTDVAALPASDRLEHARPRSSRRFPPASTASRSESRSRPMGRCRRPTTRCSHGPARETRADPDPDPDSDSRPAGGASVGGAWEVREAHADTHDPHDAAQRRPPIARRRLGQRRQPVRRRNVPHGRMGPGRRQLHRDPDALRHVLRRVM